MTFVAPYLAWGEARGGSIPRQWGCDRRATKPQGQIRRNPSGGGSFRPRRRCSLLTDPRAGYARVPVRKHLAPCLGRKLLAANVTVFTPLTTKPDVSTLNLTFNDNVAIRRRASNTSSRWNTDEAAGKGAYPFATGSQRG